MKKILAVLIALTMVFGLAVVPSFADPTKPTSHDRLNTTPSVFSSITVEGTTAYYEQDSNTGSTIYIRAELPNDTKTEKDLKSASVAITTAGASVTVKYGNTTITRDSKVGNTYNYTLDLLNKSYTVVVSSINFTLAAGIKDGIVGVDSNDPLKLTGYLDDTSNTITTFGSCQNNPYMGNPYYSTGWTFISYFFAATLPANSDIGSVSGNLAVTAGATLSVDYATGTSNYNFSSGHNATVTNGGVSRVYYPRLSVTNGTIVISRQNYDFNFTELKDPDISSYYTNTIATKVEAIETAWSAYLTQDQDDLTFQSGTTAMVVLEDFIDWAETNSYFTGTSETSNGTYLSRLNGLDASDCGYMAGYMYSIDPDGYYWEDEDDHSELATVGADGYVLSDTTYVVWFYTVDFMRWFNW